MGEENTAAAGKVPGKESQTQGLLVLDSSSPYFLHSSDHPGLNLVSSPLNEANYSTWVRAMTNALRARNKFCFVDGTLSRPSNRSADLSHWEKCNSLVISWLYNSLSTELHGSVAYADTAREIWIDLKERFSQGNAPRIHELKRALAVTYQENLSVAAYYTKLKAIWDELYSYSPIPDCTCGAVKDFLKAREEEKVHQFILGLNDNFSSVRSHILRTEPLPNISKAYALVTREEREISLCASRPTNVEAAAFNVRSHLNHRANQLDSMGSSSKPRANPKLCDHCGKSGHTKETCYKLIGYPPRDGQQDNNTRIKMDSNQKDRRRIFPRQGNFKVVNQVSQVPTNAAPMISGLTQDQVNQLISLLGTEKKLSLDDFSGPHNEEADWDG
ncbi:hypothetical protein SLEP1_g6561 [Rubroshorea leprosula]|uniref:Retrotransposon Copia-like N-terminal domain-containing protein n=1 Tax=Rubroshorea leprosula TaxID=152421 RepID=A0AAV5HVX8_9ROSI|nr:hypothetical protein SLEP1_g6561 [Rubroshorea leprosula]